MQGTLLLFEAIVLSFLGCKRFPQPGAPLPQPLLPTMDGPTCPIDTFTLRPYHGPDLPPIPLNTAKIVRPSTFAIARQDLPENTCAAIALMNTFTSPASAVPVHGAPAAHPSVFVEQCNDPINIDAQMDNLFVFVARALLVLGLIALFNLWDARARAVQCDVEDMVGFAGAMDRLREEYVRVRIEWEVWKREVGAEDLTEVSAADLARTAARNMTGVRPMMERNMCLRFEALPRAGLLPAWDASSQRTLAGDYECPRTITKTCATVGVVTNNIRATFIH